MYYTLVPSSFSSNPGKSFVGKRVSMIGTFKFHIMVSPVPPVSYRGFAWIHWAIYGEAHFRTIAETGQGGSSASKHGAPGKGFGCPDSLLPASPVLPRSPWHLVRVFLVGQGEGLRREVDQTSCPATSFMAHFTRLGVCRNQFLRAAIEGAAF